MKECNIAQVRTEITQRVQQSLVGNSTNSVINPLNSNEVVIRYSPDFPFIRTRQQAVAVAINKSDKVNQFYKAPVTSVDTSYSDVVRLAIHMPARLIHDEVNRRLNKNKRDVSINETANEFVIDGEVYPSLEDALVHYNFRNIEDIIQEQKDYIPSNYLQDNGFSQEPTTNELFSVLPRETTDYLNEVRKKANSGVTVSVSTNDYSVYTTGDNNINIDLNEVQALSQKSNIPFKEVLNITFLHELEHAATTQAIHKKYSHLIQPLFDEVKELQKINPFDDRYRFSWTDQRGLPYAFQDIYEFFSEANSNPYFVDYLKSVRSKDGKTLWEKLSDIVTQILRQLGLITTISDTNRSLYDTIQSIRTEQFNLLNQQAIDLVTKGTNADIRDVFANANTFAEIEALLKEDSIMRPFLDNVPKLVKGLKQIRKRMYDEGKLGGIDNIVESKQIKDALDSLNRIDEQEDGSINYSTENLRMLLRAVFTVSNTFKSLAEKAVALSKQEDSDDKLTKLYSIQRVAEQNEDYIDLMTKMSVELKANDKNDKAFIQDYIRNNKDPNKEEGQLRIEANSKLRQVERTLIRILDSPVADNERIKSVVTEQSPDLMIQEIYKHQSVTQVPAAKRIDENIKRLEGLLEKEKRPLSQVSMKERIQKEKDERAQLILPENKRLEGLLSGEFGDISYANMMLDSATMSKDVLTTTLSAMMKENNLNVIRNLQETANNMQVLYDQTKKELNLSNLGMIDMYKKDMIDHVLLYDVISFNPTTKEYEVKSHEQKALTSELSPDYYNQFTLFQKKLENLDYQLVSDKTDKEHIPIIKEEQKRLYKDFNEFKEKESQRPYKDEVYNLYKLYDEELTHDGKTVTLRSYKGNLYNERDSLMQQRDSTESADQAQQLHDSITNINLEIKDIKNGFGKEGLELLISQQAQKARDLSKEYKESVLTDRAKELWKAQRENKRVTLGEDSKAFRVWDQENSTLALNLPYLNRRKEIIERLNKAKQVLVDKGILQDKPNSDWQTILDISKKARDNSRITDGNLIPDNEVEKVKEIEELEQSLRDGSTGISSLSKKDFARLQELRNSNPLSADEQEEFNNLIAKQKSLKNNKDLPEVKDYLSILKELGDLTTSEETTYYQERVSKEKGTIQTRISQSQDYQTLINRLIDEQEDYTIEPGKTIRYSKEDQQWYMDVELTPGSIRSNKVSDGAQTILNKQVQKEYLRSEWFLQNHIEKIVFNNGKYTKDMVPIYIWTQKTPKSELFGEPTFEPGFTYRTSRIKEEYKNKDYKTTTDFIPFPTQTKNTRFEALRKDKVKLAFYDALSKVYLDSQVDGKRLGFLLPSGRKLEIEDLKEIKDGGIMNGVREHLTRTFTPTEQDIDLLGASTNSVNNKIIPTRLSSRIEAKNQTDDVLGNILQYVYFSERKKELTKLQALAETTYETLAQYDKTNIVTSTRGLSPITRLKNLWNGVPNTQQSKLQTQAGIQSNRTKSVRELIDKELYGQLNKGQEMKVGPFNLTKVTNSLLGLTARSIFAWNIFSPLKNTIGAGVQQIIESNAKLGYFSDKDLVWGQKQVLLKAKSLTEDSFKFGDKSLEGQMLDLFDAVVGHTFDHFGKKTTWNKVVKSKDFLFMSLLKEGSEYNLQVAQFFAVMKHTIVQDQQGNKIPLYSAYQLGKDGTKGTIQLKPGIKRLDGTDFTTDDQNRLARTIQLINYNLNGGYRLEERNNSEKYLAGKVLNFMSRYLVSGINRRYMASRYIEQDGSFQEGYYRTAWRVLTKNLIKYRLNLAANYGSLTDAEKANVQKFVRELSIMIILTGLIAGLGGGDDDRFDKSDLQQFTLALLKGSNAEVQTFSPINGADDMLRRVQNPFIVSRTLLNLEKLAVHTTQTIYQDDAAFYQQSTNGHTKGDSKALADLMKLAGMGTSNVFFGSGEELLRRQESILALR